MWPHTVANETGVFFFMINGPEIMSKMTGKSETLCKTARQSLRCLPLLRTKLVVSKKSSKNSRRSHPEQFLKYTSKSVLWY